MKNSILLASILLISASAFSAGRMTVVDVTAASLEARKALSEIVGENGFNKASDIKVYEVTALQAYDSGLISREGWISSVKVFTDEAAMKIFKMNSRPFSADVVGGAMTDSSQAWWMENDPASLLTKAALLQKFLGLHHLKSEVSLYNVLVKTIVGDEFKSCERCNYSRRLVMVPHTDGEYLITGYRVYLLQ